MLRPQKIDIHQCESIMNFLEVLQKSFQGVGFVLQVKPKAFNHKITRVTHLIIFAWFNKLKYLIFFYFK